MGFIAAFSGDFYMFWMHRTFWLAPLENRKDNKQLNLKSYKNTTMLMWSNKELLECFLGTLSPNLASTLCYLSFNISGFKPHFCINSWQNSSLFCKRPASGGKISTQIFQSVYRFDQDHCWNVLRNIAAIDSG